MTTPNKNNYEMVLTRLFNAPQSVVFDAWTNPEKIKEWWGPRMFTIPSCRVDLRVGGEMVLCMRSPDGKDYWNGGIFKEVVKPSRLVYTDYFTDEKGTPVSPSFYGMAPEFPQESLITVTFEEQSDNKTKLTLRHNLPESIVEKGGSREGWSQSLDKLNELLTK